MLSSSATRLKLRYPVPSSAGASRRAAKAASRSFAPSQPWSSLRQFVFQISRAPSLAVLSSNLDVVSLSSRSGFHSPGLCGNDLSTVFSSSVLVSGGKNGFSPRLSPALRVGGVGGEGAGGAGPRSSGRRAGGG